MTPLYKWQEECLGTWKNSGYRGIAEVTTGAGKTLMAVRGSLMLDEEMNNNLSVYVVVPKVALKKQWKEEGKIHYFDHQYCQGRTASSCGKRLHGKEACTPDTG